MNTWLPVSCSANFAMCCACVAVFVKAKNVKTKSVALPAGLSASLGITEPAIFGVNLRFVKPLVCGMIAAAIGAACGTLMGVYGSSYGVTGFPAYLITTNCTLQYTIMLLISGGIAFVLTFIFWKEEKPETAPVSASAPAAPETAAPKAEPLTVYAPIEGNVIARESIPDETFASGVLGDGVGIEPAVGAVYAPCDGEISTVAETKHAVGISSPDGMEMLIHVGIDTVKMNGDGFRVLVQEGDRVTMGQKLMTFDIDKIKKAGFNTTTAVLVTNSDDYGTFTVVQTGAAKALDKIITAAE